MKTLTAMFLIFAFATVFFGTTVSAGMTVNGEPRERPDVKIHPIYKVPYVPYISDEDRLRGTLRDVMEENERLKKERKMLELVYQCAALGLVALITGLFGGLVYKTIRRYKISLVPRENT